MEEIDYKFVHKDFRINGFPIDRERLIIKIISKIQPQDQQVSLNKFNLKNKEW